jgi:uncharacterized membrane protein YbhN (UPF0104 family)
MGRCLRLIFIWLVTIAIFVGLFSKIRFSEVLVASRQADLRMFFASILVSFAAYIFFSPAKYRVILKILGCPLSFAETLLLRMGSLPIKAVVPFRLGELGRVAYLKTRHKLSYPKGLGSILWGYVLSLFVLLFFIFIGWYFYYPDLSLIIYLIPLFIVVFLTALLFRTGVMERFFAKFLAGPHGPSALPPILAGQRPSKRIITLFLYSLGFEGCRLFNTLLLFKALGIEIPYSTFFFFAPLTLIASMLPVTLWGLGTRESSVLFFFSSYALPEKLLAASLLISFVNRLLPVLLGLFFMKPFLNRLWGIGSVRDLKDGLCGKILQNKRL